MSKALRQPKNNPFPRRRGGEQPPLLNQIEREIGNPSSPPAREEQNEPDRRIEMATLLKSCRVRFYWSLARDYSAGLIEAKVAEWKEDPDAGPGMLVKMIQEGGPMLEAEPVAVSFGQFERWRSFIERGERPPNYEGWKEHNQGLYDELIGRAGGACDE